MKNILITGQPGSGKTTLVQKIASSLQDLCPAGFYTAEIRASGVRQGFELVSFFGERRILSHTTIGGPHRVGKYGVDIPGFEEFCARLPLFVPPHLLIIIDEIGKMECMSAHFRQIVERALVSDTIFLATIALRGDGFIESVKRRSDIELVLVSPGNRHALPGLIVQKIRKMVMEKGSKASLTTGKKETG